MVSLDIQEYRHLSIRFNARGGDEPDARSDHPRVHRFEIINAEEETDPTGGANNDPAFWATVIRQRRNVFHEFELQDIQKEIDRWFVLSDNQGD